MQFLITNTGYEYETGRLQALEMLQQVGWGGGQWPGAWLPVAWLQDGAAGAGAPWCRCFVGP